MTHSEDKGSGGCAGEGHSHTHEDEEPGCRCGGECGRRNILDNLKKLAGIPEGDQVEIPVVDLEVGASS